MDIKKAKEILNKKDNYVFDAETIALCEGFLEGHAEAAAHAEILVKALYRVANFASTNSKLVDLIEDANETLDKYESKMGLESE